MGNSSTHYHYKSTTLPPYKPVATLPDEGLRIHYLTKYQSELQSSAVPYREKRLKSGKLRKRGATQKIQELRYKRAQKIPGDPSKVNFGKDRYVIVAADGSRAAKQVQPLSNKNDRIWFVKKEEHADAVQSFEFDDESTEMSMMDGQSHAEKLAQEESLEAELYRLSGYDIDGNPLQPDAIPQDVMGMDTFVDEEEEYERQEEALRETAAQQESAVKNVVHQETPQAEPTHAEETPQDMESPNTVQSARSSHHSTAAVEDLTATITEEQTPQVNDDTSVQSARSSQNSSRPADENLTTIEDMQGEVEKRANEGLGEKPEPNVSKGNPAATDNTPGAGTPQPEQDQPLTDVTQKEPQDELEQEMQAFENEVLSPVKEERRREEVEEAKQKEEEEQHIDDELNEALAMADQPDDDESEVTEEEQTEEEHTDDEGAEEQ